MNKLKAFWASLPHQVQAALILFGTVAGTTLAKEIQAYIFGTLNFSKSSLEHDVSMALFAGFVAVKAFYSQPSPTSIVTPVAK